MKELETLAAARRNGEPVKAMVRSVGTRKMAVRDEEQERTVMKEVECAVFELEGGVKGLCPIFEFSDHKFNSLIGFTGTVHDVMILELDIENKLAVVSVKAANHLKREAFWKKLNSLEEGQVPDEVFEGYITGFNKETQTIFVNIEGQTCFIKRLDWDYTPVRNMDEEIQRNQRVQVKIVRFNKEQELVQVSRKAAMEDPFVKFKEQFKVGDTLVGMVSAVHPIHGIFVQLSKGVQIKASKPKYVEAPVVGDIVSLRLDSIDEEKRQARGIIINYPQGKKRVKDLGSFLYE